MCRSSPPGLAAPTLFMQIIAPRPGGSTAVCRYAPPGLEAPTLYVQIIAPRRLTPPGLAAPLFLAG
jgi:hypothetical protein